MHGLNCCNRCIPVRIKIHLTVTGVIVKRTDVEINIVSFVIALFQNMWFMRSQTGGKPQISDQFQRIMQCIQFSRIVKLIRRSPVMVDGNGLIAGNQSNMRRQIGVLTPFCCLCNPLNPSATVAVFIQDPHNVAIRPCQHGIDSAPFCFTQVCHNPISGIVILHLLRLCRGMMGNTAIWVAANNQAAHPVRPNGNRW